MYLGVDIGGTKTLVAVLEDDSTIVEKTKFPTPKNYDHWLLELRNKLHHFEHQDFHAAGVGIPAVQFDRDEGIAISFGNLPWRNIHIQQDVERAVKCPVVVENDAKLAGLSEAMLLKDRYERVLYVTVSTGIGYGLVVDKTIDANVGDGGGRTLLLEHKGKQMPWEDFASGRAIVERYGKRAADIHDEATWKRIVHDLGLGLIELIAITEPEVIVMGGSVGNQLPKFKDYLIQELKKYEIPLIKLPHIIEAQRPVEAVVFGCYDLAKQRYGSVTQPA